MIPRSCFGVIMISDRVAYIDFNLIHMVFPSITLLRNGNEVSTRFNTIYIASDRPFWFAIFCSYNRLFGENELAEATIEQPGGWMHILIQ